MNFEKKGNCDDCGIFNTLIKVDACVHDLMGDGECCYKYVYNIENPCEFKCTYCKAIIKNVKRDKDFLGYIELSKCDKCKKENHIVFQWWGRTPNKARDLIPTGYYD